MCYIPSTARKSSGVVSSVGLVLLLPVLMGIGECSPTQPPPLCGSVNAAIGYGNEAYGGSWAALHRDGRNSDFADCEVGTTYEQNWALRIGQHAPPSKPVIGPDRRAWLVVNPVVEGDEDPTFLYGVDIDTGLIAVQLGTSSSLNSSLEFGEPLIDVEGNLFIGQELDRPAGTPCRFEGQSVNAGQLCGEFMSFDGQGTPRWRIATDGVSLSAQWTVDGKVLLQTWRGTTYVIDPDPTTPDEQRVLSGVNSFPEAAVTLPSEVDKTCVATGQGDTCIIANTPAIHPTTGAIYNTVQGFAAGRTDTFLQRWTYDPATHAVELDPAWDISAPIVGGSASSPVIHFDGSALFVNDSAGGVYSLDSESGKVLAKTLLPYTPGGSIISLPELSPSGTVIGAYLIFNLGFSTTLTNYVTLVHYRQQGGTELEIIRSLDGSDGSGVAWLATGGSSAGVTDTTVMSPELRIGTIAQKSCGGCARDGEQHLLIIDPKTASILSAVALNVPYANLSLAPDRSFITSHGGNDLMRRFVATDGEVVDGAGAQIKR